MDGKLQLLRVQFLAGNITFEQLRRECVRAGVGVMNLIEHMQQTGSSQQDIQQMRQYVQHYYSVCLRNSAQSHEALLGYTTRMLQIKTITGVYPEFKHEEVSEAYRIGAGNWKFCHESLFEERIILPLEKLVEITQIPFNESPCREDAFYMLLAKKHFNEARRWQALTQPSIILERVQPAYHNLLHSVSHTLDSDLIIQKMQTIMDITGIPPNHEFYDALLRHLAETPDTLQGSARGPL